MNNILTIDFDIIMSPSINLYNDLIEGEKSINKIINAYPLLEPAMTADLYLYDNLTRLLVQLFRRLAPENIYFIREHHNIIKIIKNLSDINLYNIDHHHDIGYNNVKVNTKISLPDCGNWVKYLSDKGNIKSYTWIKNNNSIMPIEFMRKTYIKDCFNIENYNLNNIIKNVDKLIICNSPQWIPNYIQPLFITWMSIGEEIFDTIFNLED